MKKISLEQLKSRIKREVQELGVIQGQSIFIEHGSDILTYELSDAWDAIREHFKKSGLCFQEFHADSQQFCWVIGAKELTKDQRERFSTLFVALEFLEDEDFEEDSWVAILQDDGIVSEDECPGNGFPDCMTVPSED